MKKKAIAYMYKLQNESIEDMICTDDYDKLFTYPTKKSVQKQMKECLAREIADGILPMGSRGKIYTVYIDLDEK